MNECTSGELRDLLPELLNQRLDAATRERVEAHVASCAECAAELAALRALRPVLVAAPVIDTQRIAAAVRAQTAVGIARAPARARFAGPWKIAIAAAALIAVTAIGYVSGVWRSQAPEHVAAAPSSVTPIPDTPHTTLSPESTHAPRAVPPRALPHAPTQQVAITPPPSAPATRAPVALASTGMLENVSDLSDDDVRELSASLDKLSAVPNADPTPAVDPLGATLDDLSGGGR